MTDPLENPEPKPDELEEEIDLEELEQGDNEPNTEEEYE